MADAKKCDRCGAFYEAYKPGRNSAPFNGLDAMLLSPRDEHLVTRLELCPACANYLYAVLTAFKDPAPQVKEGS